MCIIIYLNRYVKTPENEKYFTKVVKNRLEYYQTQKRTLN